MKKKLKFSVPLILVSIFLFYYSNNITSDKSQIQKDDLVELKTIQNTDTQIKKSKNPKTPFSEKKKKVKGMMKNDSPDEFAKWHNSIRVMPGKEKSGYKINYQIKELLKAKGVSSTKRLSKSILNSQLDWRELGPGNVAGRTRAILVHPEDHDLWYVGSVGGGVWKTPDAGQTWINLTEDLPNLATSTLAWSELYPNIIYAGTGEGFFNTDQIDGSGIWKTTDAGQTWNQLEATAINPAFENVMRMTVDPNNTDIIVVAVTSGLQNRSSLSTSAIYRSIDGGETWEKTYDTGDRSFSIQDLKANPLNFNTQYATIKRKCVIKSYDGGLTWFESSDGITNVGRMELAISPSDTNIIYVAADLGPNSSTLYSSDNGGKSWVYHNSSTKNELWLGMQGWYDNTIAVNPYNKNQVFLGGIQLWQADISHELDSIGQKITSVDLENTESFLDIYRDASIGQDFHGKNTKLLNEDYTSIEIRFGTGFSQKAHRFEWAEDFQYPYLDYVTVPFEVWDIDNNKQLMVSFRDHDNDSTWNPKNRLEAPDSLSREYIFVHAIDYSADSPSDSIAKTAGMVYRNTYAFWPESPTGISFDPNNIPSAIIRVNWNSIYTKDILFTNIAHGYDQTRLTKGVHVDHHNIVIIKTDEDTQGFRLVNGNDGGIAFSDDKGETFSQTGFFNRSSGPNDKANEVLLGYNTSQFFGIDKANGVDRYIGGMQDNGSWVSPENPNEKSSWNPAPSGDGFEAVWHYNDINKMIETSQYNTIYRTLDGGNSWHRIGSDIQSGPFFTKIGSSKQDPDLIFTTSREGIWRSNDFGTNWTLTTMPEGFYGNLSNAQIKISLHNPNIVWSGSKMTESSSVYVSTDGGSNFNATNYYSDVELNYISGFATHPLEDSTAYALFSYSSSPKILKTTDLGNTWNDLSGFGINSTSDNGFPDVAVYSLLVMPYNTDIIWVGTEIGLFESRDRGQNWAYADNGLPAVSIYEMVIVNDEIVLATHGRGAWAVSMPELEGYEPPEATLLPRITEVSGGPGGKISASIVFPSLYDSANIFIDDQKMVSLPANAAYFDTLMNITVLASDIEIVNLYTNAYKNGKIYSSAKIPIEIYGLGEGVYSYSNNFDIETNDFIGSGFEIATLENFNNGALHSQHNYIDGTISTFILKKIINIPESDIFLSYDDIAIIEPSDSGTKCGDFGFWDYVIVEASNDFSKTWIPLAEGYDARYSQDWLNSYLTGTPVPNSTMFKNHSINLLDIFNPGDKVIIRFKIYADASINGWGWVIDNLEINSEVVGINDKQNIIPSKYILSNNYPNPFNPSTTIQFGIPTDNKVVIKIYDIIGQEVTTLIDAQLKAGFHSINWGAVNMAGGVYLYRIESGNFSEVKKMVLLK